MIKICTLALAVLITFSLCSTQANARPGSRFDEGTQTCRLIGTGPAAWDASPYGEGGKIFKDFCKGCHFRGNDKDAPFLWSESKSSKAWNRVFAKRYPQCAKDGTWEVYALEQIMKVNDYLYRFSSSSLELFDNC